MWGGVYGTDLCAGGGGKGLLRDGLGVLPEAVLELARHGAEVTHAAGTSGLAPDGLLPPLVYEVE